MSLDISRLSRKKEREREKRANQTITYHTTRILRFIPSQTPHTYFSDPFIGILLFHIYLYIAKKNHTHFQIIFSFSFYLSIYYNLVQLSKKNC
ncbi:hypothetical protein F4703DRAFT_1469167 [Phycomyces blakesleeanus]